MYDVAIVNGTLVVPKRGLINAQLGVRDGRIAFLGPDDLSADAAEVIDARGKLVFPGLIDPHVHLGNHLPYFQDFKTETRSAAAGGITSIVTQLKIGLFADTSTSYFSIFDKLLKDLQGLSSVDFSFHFHVPNERYADEIADYYSKLGIQSYKFHMGYRPKKEEDDTSYLQRISPGIDDGVIYSVLRKVGTLEPRPVMTVHCECDEVIYQTTLEAKRSGLTGLACWDAARPDVAEELAVSRLGALARYTGASVYVVHVSSSRGLDAIRDEKRKGTRIRAETCPQYLWLTTGGPGTLGKVSPPIRSQENLDGLWEGIRDGTIDCVGTDHGAKYRKSKVDDIWEATLGFPGVETLLPLMITGAKQRKIPLERVAELCSLNPAITFGLYPRKGTLEVGSDADIVIVDPDRKAVIDSSKLHSEADFTPFEGIEVFGWPEITLLRGRRVFDDGQFPDDRIGEFVPRFPDCKAPA